MELREHGGRLVCDACGGILMTLADFDAAVIDLGALDTVPRDRGETQNTCPRCGAPLQLATLTVDRREVTRTVLRCSSHGLWFEGGALEHVFIEIGRRTSRISTKAPPASGGWSSGISNMPAVSYTPSEKRKLTFRPRARTSFQSAFADTPLSCPDCKGRLLLNGMVWTCIESPGSAGARSDGEGHRGGVIDHGGFVEYAALESMVAEMTGNPWEPAWATDAPTCAHGCPACSEAMLAEKLAGKDVERCPTDGVWFAPGVLEEVLGKLGGSARRGFFARLFGKP